MHKHNDSRRPLVRYFFLLASLQLAISILSWGWGQQDKPWERPGTQTGAEIVGPDGGKMLWVPPGEFMMGSEDGPDNERPPHHVHITKGFWLGKYEVTVGQWKQFIKAAGVPWDEEHFFMPDNHPMTGISWLHCQAYCRFYGLSLPTEAQWEWAARGPEGRLYPWGNFWNPRLCCNKQNPGPAIPGVPLRFTAPVGSFPEGASWCGAHDMAGNVDEWCADWLSPTYYAHSPVEDPPGPSAGTERVLRGGYCWGNADECRATRRFSSEPDNDGAGGLRVCYVP